jgi:hypothetical protein
MAAAILSISRVEAERRPNLRPVVHHVHARWHDADHFARESVDFNRLPDDVLTAKRGLPQFVRQDDDRRERGRGGAGRWGWTREVGFPLPEQAPVRRLHAEGGEEAVIDSRRSHAKWTITSCQVDFAGGERPNCRKRLVDLTELEIFGR